MAEETTRDNPNNTTYVYLEFGEKITPNIFSNKFFLRVANLHKREPLVQVNDLLFKGTYDECIGTNLFLEEMPNPPPLTNIFEKETPITLTPFIKQTKVIRLNQVKLPRNITSSSGSGNNKFENVKLNFNHDYKILLEKLEQGILDIRDLGKDTDDPMNTTGDHVNTHPPLLKGGFSGNTTNLSDQSSSDLLEKYEKLKEIARRPVKRMKFPEVIADPELRFRDAYEYHNLEKMVLQTTDFVPYDKSDNILKHVNLERCILQGLVPSSIRHLPDPDKISRLFSLNNLQNLSLQGRHLVLKDCVAKIEDLITNTPIEELREIDENGRSVHDICQIFRKLVSALENQMSDATNFIVQGRSNDDFLNGNDEDYYVKFKIDPLGDGCHVFDDEEWTDGDDEGSGQAKIVAKENSAGSSGSVFVCPKVESRGTHEDTDSD